MIADVLVKPMDFRQHETMLAQVDSGLYRGVEGAGHHSPAPRNLEIGSSELNVFVGASA